MPKRQVVLLSDGSVLAAGVERLLQSQEDIAFTCWPADAPDLGARLRQAVPHVVVVDAGDAALGARLLARVLESQPRARVVALDLHRLDISVYRRERVVETTQAGLLEAVRGTASKRRGAPRGGREVSDGREEGKEG